MGEKSVIDCLENDLTQSIKNDLIAVLQFHEKQQISGFHSIPREVFCYIDYIGSLVSGSSTSDNAINFIEKYMSRINIRYKYFGKLIYEMWRHGTIHEFDPKILKHSQRKYIIGWLANNDSHKGNRGCHLECFKKHGTINTYLLNINLFELVDNLEQSLRLLINDLKKKNRLREIVQSNFTQISQPIFANKIKKNKKLKRILSLQITRAVKSQTREVDDNGNVLTYSSTAP